MLVLSIILIILTALYFYFKNVNTFWIKRGVKQGSPKIIVGHSWGVLSRQYSLAEMVEYVYKMCPNTRYARRN